MSLSETAKAVWLVVSQFAFVAIIVFASVREYLLGNVTAAAEVLEVGMVVLFLSITIGVLSFVYGYYSNGIEKPTQSTK